MIAGAKIDQNFHQGSPLLMLGGRVDKRVSSKPACETRHVFNMSIVRCKLVRRDLAFLVSFLF